MTTESGGFLLPSLPSTPYSTASTSSIIGHRRLLPVPRASSLKPGSTHEAALIRYLDEGLLDVSRKFSKKHSQGGYFDIHSVVKDLERLVDLIWVSATPSLQIQYLLQIANSFNDYLASFPLNLKATFTFIDVLDRCFHSLITGHSADPYSTPISAAMTSHISTTEKVRLNSIIQRTRLHVVKIIEEGPSNIPGRETEEAIPDTLSTESVTDGTSRSTTPATDITDISVGSNDNQGAEGQDEDENEDGDLDEEEWEMAIARLYELSLYEVGEQLLRTG